MRRWSGWLLAVGFTVSLPGCGPWKAVDVDGDGFAGADDCWDQLEGPPGSGLSSAQIHAGAAETWYDGIDQDCSGGSDYDQDGDGHDITPVGDDCLDVTDQSGFANRGELAPGTVYPGATEVYYNGTDEDCGAEVDGQADDDGDQDGDGYWIEGYAFTLPSGASGGDCDDEAGAVNPGEEEVWYDGVDADCAGDDDFDQDGDGAPCAAPADADGSCTGDCDDTDPDRFPDGSVDEIWYNGVDENCDGNDGDQDGDGYWVEGYPFDLPDGAQTGDCLDDPDAPLDVLNGFPDPAARDVHPGGADVWYDNVDGDCAGDDDFDQDLDGFRTSAYNNGSGVAGTDCDDEDAAIQPGAAEIWYDGVDQNCDDDSLDDDYDQDGDGVRSSAYVGTDCDDTDARVLPGATETCATAYDDDCDGSVNTDTNLAIESTGCSDFRRDSDGDGYGLNSTACLCVAEYPYTAPDSGAADCDDTDGAVSPGASETCATAYDDDCDGISNEQGVAACTSWYGDGDSDGYGDPADTVCQCSASAAYPVADNTDCDDGTSNRSPGTAETCDDVDNDCDGSVDDGLTLYYSDADGDGFGDENEPGTCHLSDTVDGVADDTDCDDGEFHVYPGAIEICDLQANDCATAGSWATADEYGIVTEFADNAGWADAAATNLTWDTTAGSVTVYSVSANDRRINVCPGTYYQAISATSNTFNDVRIEGIYGATLTTLATGGALPDTTWTGPLVRISQAKIELAGLTISGGTGTTSSYGGSVLVSSTSTNQGTTNLPNLLLEDCVVSGGVDEYGGGIVVGDSSNLSQTYGYVRLLDTLVTGNRATAGSGGGALIYRGTLECEATNPAAGTYGFTANSFSGTGSSGGAVYLLGFPGVPGSGIGTFISQGCDFGNTTPSNNGAVEIDGSDNGTLMTDYNAVNDANFTCTIATGCL